ncbi:MAG: hypothetical protein ACRYFU_26430 [Janthinobacterium lividum]
MSVPVEGKKPVRDTLQMLKRGRAGSLALVGVLLLSVVIGARVDRAAMEEVGREAAPSIVAAQHMKAALAAMDADEVNELLAPPSTASAASDGVLRRRAESEQALLKAAENVKSEAEHKVLGTLQESGGSYNRLAQKAEDLHDAGSADAVFYYRAEAGLMDNVLLPAADELDRVNNDALVEAFPRHRVQGMLLFLFVALAGVLLVVTLVRTQMFLSHRMRRTLNPALLVATLTSVALVLYGLGAMGTAQHQLGAAKGDAFESVHALWRARAVAYQANAELSRVLLDPVHAADYAKAFAHETGTLAQLPAGMSMDQVVANREGVPAFTGFLSEAWGNITFRGERDAAVRMLTAYQGYLQMASEIFRLEAAGKHANAVKLCVGGATSESTGIFRQFDTALGDTLAINQKEFDRSVEVGIDAVGDTGGKMSAAKMMGTLEFKAVLVCGLLAVLVLLGFAPRIREYA